MDTRFVAWSGTGGDPRHCSSKGSSCTRAMSSRRDARGRGPRHRRRLLPGAPHGARRRRRLCRAGTTGGARLRGDGPPGGSRSRHLSRRPRRPANARSICEAGTRRRGSSRREGPPLTYFRAAMVVGAGSESYRTLRYLVQRLPVMIAPSWLRTPTQPIGIDDVVSYLTQAPDVRRAPGARSRSAGPTSSPMARCSIAWRG